MHRLVGATQEADCSVVPVVVPWPFLVKHYKHAAHDLRRDASCVPHEAAYAEQFLRRLHRPTICIHAGTVSLRPRYTCAVPRHRARRPLMLHRPRRSSDQFLSAAGIANFAPRNLIGPFIQKLVLWDKQVAIKVLGLVDIEHVSTDWSHSRIS